MVVFHTNNLADGHVASQVVQSAEEKYNGEGVRNNNDIQIHGDFIFVFFWNKLTSHDFVSPEAVDPRGQKISSGRPRSLFGAHTNRAFWSRGLFGLSNAQGRSSIDTLSGTAPRA
jgi:hypothetical protein